MEREHRLTRRGLLRALAAGGGLAPLLWACGGDQSAGGRTSAPAPAASSPAAAPASGASAAPSAPASSPAVVAGARGRGGTLNVGLTSDSTTLDPHFTTALADSHPNQHLYDRLVEFDDQNQLTPGLAESWRAVDEKTYELKLRQGVVFHDGAKFNAAAAKANFDRILAPDSGSPRKGEIPNVDSAEVVDEYTLRLKLKSPFSSLIYNLAGNPGIMVSPDAIQKYGKDLARNPVGTGPFAFGEWVTGDHLTLKRNERYWRADVPRLDQIVFRGIADSTVRLNALQSGAIHVMEQPDPTDLAALKRDPRFNVVQIPSLGVTSIRLRNDQPPFDKLEVRQALALAVDRALINKAIYFDTGVPAQSFLPPDALGYDKAYQPYPQRDIAAAKAKLAAAGMGDGLSFTILITPADARLAQALKDQLAEAGITMELEQVDSPTLLDRLVKKQFSAILVSYFGNTEPYAGLSRFFNSASPLDVYGYAKPEYDALLEKASATEDIAARTEIYKQANKMLGDDVPWIFLRHADNLAAYDKNVQDVVYLPTAVFRFWNTSLKS